MPGDETTISTGRIKQAVLRVLHHPLNQARDDRVRGVIRARLFL
jgi:hypothetical protein